MSSADPTEQEKIEFLEQAIKALNDPQSAGVFKDSMKELGTHAVLTDEAFSHVKNTMDAFVRDKGSEYPGIKTYQSEWDGYKTEWSNLITASRDFAVKTATEYDDYALLLQAISEVSTKDELHLLADDFKTFGTTTSEMPIDLKDKFVKLKGKVEDFQKRFSKYLDSQKANLTEEAQKLNDEIQELEKEIAGLDAEIKKEAIALGIATWWGPLAAFAAGTKLAKLAEQRADKQKELDAKRGELKNTESKQSALAQIRAQFAGLIPDFQLLAANLGLFADIRNAFHEEALDFAGEFKKVDLPKDLPVLYQLRIKLALATTGPLTQGLKGYAATIHF